MVPRATNGATPVQRVESATNKQNALLMDFADGAAELFAEATVAMPSDWDGGTVTAVFYWMPSNTSTNPILWTARGRSYGDQETFDQAQGTLQSIQDTPSGTANQVHITGATPTITFSGTPAASEVVQFAFSRDPTSGSDTFTGTGRLMGVMITYTRA